MSSPLPYAAEAEQEISLEELQVYSLVKLISLSCSIWKPNIRQKIRKIALLLTPNSYTLGVSSVANTVTTKDTVCSFSIVHC